MFQIPTRIEPAYTAENIFTFNQKRLRPALHRGNILSVNLMKPVSENTLNRSDIFTDIPASAPHISQIHHPQQAAPPSAPPVSSAPVEHHIPPLRNIIQKGQKVRIGMVGQIPRIRVALGWNVSNAQCDIDLSAYLLDASGKVPGDDWFVFYGQTLSPDGSVTLYTDGSASDREFADIDFFKLNASIRKIVFVLTINEAREQSLNFSMVRDAYIRILDPDSGQEIYSFMLTDYYDNVTSMMLGEVYLHNTEWKFNAIGNGVARDLAGLCQLYGVETN